jgi:hypothetical protein
VRAPKPPGNPLRECPPAGCADLPLNFAAGIARWLKRAGWYLPGLHNLRMNDLFDTAPTTDPTDAVTLAHYAERAYLEYAQRVCLGRRGCLPRTR